MRGHEIKADVKSTIFYWHSDLTVCCKLSQPLMQLKDWPGWSWSPQDEAEIPESRKGSCGRLFLGLELFQEPLSSICLPELQNCV